MSATICPKCAAENRPQASFCIRCGAKLVGLDPPAQPPSPPPASPPDAPVSQLSGPAAALRPGLLLVDRYTIHEPDAQDEFTITYPAWDNRAQVEVTVTQVLDKPAESLQYIVSILQRYARLTHPNLLHLVEIINPAPEVLYVVGEYPAGKTLEQLIQEHGPLPTATALRWLGQICAALVYLLKEIPDYTCVDISPARILVSPDEKVKLKGICEADLVGTQWMRPGYSAPEQYAGQADERSLVYALGGTLYTMLTGQAPPEAVERASGAALTPIAKLRPGAPSQIERLVLKALALPAEQRFPSIEAFYELVLSARAGTAGSPLSTPALAGQRAASPQDTPDPDQPQPGSPSPGEQDVPEGMQFCPYCHMPHRKESKFCPITGKRLVPSPSPAPPRPSWEASDAPTLTGPTPSPAPRRPTGATPPAVPPASRPGPAAPATSAGPATGAPAVSAFPPASPSIASPPASPPVPDDETFIAPRPAPRPPAPSDPTVYSGSRPPGPPAGAAPPMPPPAQIGAPRSSASFDPTMQAPSPIAAARGSSQPITRFGRVEYSSPMDVGQEYRLRIGLLLERHGKRLLEGARVHWSTLRIASQEAEPVIRITPSSGYLNVSPPFRDIKVSKLRDVFADFRLTPHHVGSRPNGACQVQVDFEYQGEIIHELCLDARIQDPFTLGPVKIPHKYWKGFGLVGGGIASFETAASLFNLYNPAGSLWHAALFGAGLLGAFLLLLIAIFLWQGAARRLKKRF